MKLAMRISGAVFPLFMAVGIAPVRGDTLNMPVLPPITFNDRVDMRYTIENTSVGLLGKFAASGRSVNVVGGGVVVFPGTFTLNAYFNPTTGQIIKDHLTDNALDPLLDVRDAGNNLLYFSRHINRFAYDLGVTLPTFDFEFFNEGGAMPALNPLALIGATLRNATMFTGTQSFISGLPAGSIVFNNNQVMGIEAGTANVFMTPTPTAVGGGIMLLGCMFIGGTMRRRSDGMDC